MKEKILVHICCAPDLLFFLKKLKEDFSNFEIIGYFYDPNIHPEEEYVLRLVETKRICNTLNIRLYEGAYDFENWMSKVRGLEEEPERGERCKVCFDLRLEKAFEKAKELKCNFVTTTLLMSPKKDINQIKNSGEKLEKKYRIKFLAPDYRKGGGTQQMFKLARDSEIYMQDYCGCVYGMFNQGKDPHLYLSSIKGRRPGSKEELLFIKRIKYAAESMELSTKEYPFPFLGWILLQGSIFVDDEPIESVVEPYSMGVKGIVKGVVERENGNTLYLNRGFVRIKLRENVSDELPVKFRGLIHPTFVVHEYLRLKLRRGRIRVTLQTKFEEMKSLVMLVGSEKAEYIIGVPADTTQKGKGVNEEEVLGLLSVYYEDIYRSKLSVVILGAEINGGFGSKVFKDMLDREINNFMEVNINV